MKFCYLLLWDGSIGLNGRVLLCELSKAQVCFIILELPAADNDCAGVLKDSTALSTPHHFSAQSGTSHSHRRTEKTVRHTEHRWKDRGFFLEIIEEQIVCSQFQSLLFRVFRRIAVHI